VTREGLVAGGLVLALLVACGGRQQTNRVDANDAIVVVKTNVADANVYVDGRYYGPVRLLRGGLAFEAGHHRLELRHEDYFSRYVELDLKASERRKLDLDLAPVLP
jgi:hypothetical protein